MRHNVHRRLCICITYSRFFVACVGCCEEGVTRLPNRSCVRCAGPKHVAHTLDNRQGHNLCSRPVSGRSHHLCAALMRPITYAMLSYICVHMIHNIAMGCHLSISFNRHTTWNNKLNTTSVEFTKPPNTCSMSPSSYKEINVRHRAPQSIGASRTEQIPWNQRRHVTTPCGVHVGRDHCVPNNTGCPRIAKVHCPAPTIPK